VADPDLKLRKGPGFKLFACPAGFSPQAPPLDWPLLFTCIPVYAELLTICFFSLQYRFLDSQEKTNNYSINLKNKNVIYTLFQNGRHLSILLFSCKLALVASFLNSKFERIFSLERGDKG